MIDLTHAETLITNAKLVPLVEGATSIKPALDKGIATQSAVFVLPLLTPAKKVSGGTIREYERLEKFAAVVALKTGGKGGSNKQFSDLVNGVEDALVGNILPGTQCAIELGNGGQIPTKLVDHVFWQTEFSIRTFKRG